MVYREEFVATQLGGSSVPSAVPNALVQEALAGLPVMRVMLMSFKRIFVQGTDSLHASFTATEEAEVPLMLVNLTSSMCTLSVCKWKKNCKHVNLCLCNFNTGDKVAVPFTVPYLCLTYIFSAVGSMRAIHNHLKSMNQLKVTGISTATLCHMIHLPDFLTYQICTRL